MTDSCKVYIRAQISRTKFRQILKLFSLDLTASQIAVIASLNRNTVNRYLKLTRTLIADFCARESPFIGNIECDESYFGSRHKSGKRGRGAENKHIVFGIYKRNGKVYTELVKNVKAKTLQAIIKGRVDLHSTLYTDGFRTYDSVIRGIIEFITKPIMPLVMFTSMASKASGDMPKFDWLSFAVYQRTHSICT